MSESTLLPELIARAAQRAPLARALTHGAASMTYEQLHHDVERFADGANSLGLQRFERVGIYLEKRFETVIASFGAAAAGGAFVPLKPLLKPEQVAYILRDCNVRVLVTSPERLALLSDVLGQCVDLRHVVVTDAVPQQSTWPATLKVTAWDELLDLGRSGARAQAIDVDMAAILYTSGSTGKPKGVVLSHRNMVAGAKSVEIGRAHV